MIWALLGGIPLALIVIAGVTVMVIDDAAAFLLAIAITGALAGSLWVFLYGLADLGVIK